MDEGWFSLLDAQMVNDSASPIAKNDILIMTDALYLRSADAACSSVRVEPKRSRLRLQQSAPVSTLLQSPTVTALRAQSVAGPWASLPIRRTIRHRPGYRPAFLVGLEGPTRSKPDARSSTFCG